MDDLRLVQQFAQQLSAALKQADYFDGALAGPEAFGANKPLPANFGGVGNPYAQYAPPAAPAMAPISDSEIASAGTGLPKTIGEMYNPFTARGRDAIADAIGNTELANTVSTGIDRYNEFARGNPVATAASNLPATLIHATDPRNKGNVINTVLNGLGQDPTNTREQFNANMEQARNDLQAEQAAAAAQKAAPVAATSAPASGNSNASFDYGSLLPGLGGAGAGALLASALGDKKKRGRNALLGAGLGGGAGLLLHHLMNKKQAAADPYSVPMGQVVGEMGGLGAGVGGVIGGGLGGIAGLISPGEYEENGVKKQRGRLMGGLRGAGKGALTGAVAGGAGGALSGAAVTQLARILHDAAGKPGQKSAFDVGKTLGDAGTYLKGMYNQMPEGIRQGVGMGGLGGAALGGLAGLVSPGEEDSVDEYGRPVRKQRGRFGAMLRGALGGGAAGALGGAAMGHFAPGMTGQAYNAASNFGSGLAQRLGLSSQNAKPLNTANPQTLEEMMAADAQKRQGEYARSYIPGPLPRPYNIP